MSLQKNKIDIDIMLFKLSEKDSFKTRNGQEIIERLKTMIMHSQSITELTVVKEIINGLLRSNRQFNKKTINKYLNIINEIKNKYY